jgi:hypothetical protein
MKITIEDEHTTVTIDNRKDFVTATDAVRLYSLALLALSYQPKSIEEAMEEVRNNG